MARSQSELFMQQLLGSCSDRSLSLKCTPRAVPRTTVWPALRNTLGFSRQTGRSSMLPSALAHRRRRKRPALGTFLPVSFQDWNGRKPPARVSQPFGYDTGCGTAASEAPDRAEIGPEFQNWSSRVRRPVAFPWKRPTVLVRSPQDDRSRFPRHVPHRKVTAVRKPVQRR